MGAPPHEEAQRRASDEMLGGRLEQDNEERQRASSESPPGSRGVAPERLGEEDGLPVDSDPDSTRTGPESDAEYSRQSDLSEQDGAEDDLVFLGPDHCRVTMLVKVGPNRIPCVCGRLTRECGRQAHRRKRETLARNPVGAYSRLVTPTGFQNHGQRGLTYLTEAQWEARRNPAAHPEVQQAAREEGERLLRESRTMGTTPAALPRVTFTDRTQSPARPPRNQWHGLEGWEGNRVVTPSFTEAKTYQEGGYRPARIFTSREEAEAWRLSPASVEEVAPPARSPSPRQRKPRAPQAPSTDSSEESLSDTSEDSDSSSSESDSVTGTSSDSSAEHRRRRKKKKEKSKKKKSNRRSNSSRHSSSHRSSHQRMTGGAPFPSLGSTLQRVQNNYPAARAVIRTSRSKEKKIRASLHGTDPSIGTEEEMYGANINSDTLMKALCPKGMASDEMNSVFQVAVDVVGLPGMYSLKSEETAIEAERAHLDLTGLLQAAASGGGAPTLSDTTWRAQSRHQLRKVKSYPELAELLGGIERIKERAFQQQNNQLRVLMRGWRDKEIVHYQQQGGLTLITQASLRFYLGLLHAVRDLYYEGGREVGGGWSTSHACSLLKHHSERLLAIRTSSYSKGNFVLQTYTYLRDAHKKNYNDSTMMSNLWKEISLLKQGPCGPGSPRTALGDLAASGSGGATCNHCRSVLLHSQFGRLPTKAGCPLRQESQTRARKAGRRAESILSASPNLPLEDVTAQAMEGT